MTDKYSFSTGEANAVLQTNDGFIRIGSYGGLLRFDGRGCNEGLKAEEIPLFARIIGVADAYDAMHSTRCYRPELSTDFILAELEKGKGAQFDPQIAEPAIAIIRKEEKNNS